MNLLRKFGYLSCLILLSTAHGQEPAVQMATHVAPAASAGTVIRFAASTAAIGEWVNQRVGMELNLHTLVKQSGKVAHDSHTNMRSRQEREIEVLDVSDGKAVSAKVTYRLSRSMSPENPNPADEVVQAVEGKTYLIKRNGERLLVTDTEGAIPPREEYDIVVSSMESFGQPNLLAEFLLPRELRIGERLEVPADIARKMMGFDSFGEVQKFELHLQEVKDVSGRKCAVFAASIAAVGQPDSPIRVSAQGNVIIELTTCRTLEATLTGPLSLTTVDNQTEYSATGELLLAIRSHYDMRK